MNSFDMDIQIASLGEDFATPVCARERWGLFGRGGRQNTMLNFQMSSQFLVSGEGRWAMSACGRVNNLQMGLKFAVGRERDRYYSVKLSRCAMDFVQSLAIFAGKSSRIVLGALVSAQFLSSIICFCTWLSSG